MIQHLFGGRGFVGRRTQWAGLVDADHGASAGAAAGGVDLVGHRMGGVQHPDVVLLVELDAVDGNAVEDGGVLQDVGPGVSVGVDSGVGDLLAPGAGGAGGAEACGAGD